MTAALLVWALALAIPAALWLLMRRKTRRVTREPDPGELVQAPATRQRTERHEALLAAMDDWLNAEATVEAFMAAGFNPRRLYDMRNEIGHMDEAQLLAAAAVLLRTRNVRRAIAKWMEARYRWPHGVGMKCLMQIADLKESA
jgi:hypothetical protein